MLQNYPTLMDITNSSVDEFVQKKKGKGIISKTAAIILHQSIRAKNLV
jgi:hypothetical protein